MALSKEEKAEIAEEEALRAEIRYRTEKKLKDRDRPRGCLGVIGDLIGLIILFFLFTRLLE